MSSCERILQLAQVRLDGELPATVAADVDAHLVACPPCARVLSLDARLRAVLRERIGIEPAPARLHARVRAMFGPRS